MISVYLPIYILALYGLVRLFSRVNAEKKNKVNWDALESVAITLTLYFGSQLIAALVFFVFTGLHNVGSSTQYWLEHSVSAQFVFVLIVEFLVLWGLRSFLRRRKASFRTIGFINPRWRDIGWTLIGFGMYFVLFVGVSLLAKALVPSLNVDQNQEIGFDTAQGASLALVFISLVVLPPIVEEILMRGFLYSGLKKQLPKIWAVIITSLLFALAHLQAGNDKPLLWIAAIDTFCLSLVLIYLREKTGGLWASIGLHTLKNFIAFLALFIFVH